MQMGVHGPSLPRMDALALGSVFDSLAAAAFDIHMLDKHLPIAAMI